MLYGYSLENRSLSFCILSCIEFFIQEQISVEDIITEVLLFFTSKFT